MNRLFCISTILFFSVTNVFSQTLSKNGQQRLLAFAELYSTVKYYYPDPNLQGFPWDAFAYRGYQLAKNAKNDQEFVQKIDSLFSIITPGVQISRKNFDLARITPEDTARYFERAFWQHRGGLNVDRVSKSNHSALNYIYKKPVDEYTMSYTLPSKDLQGKDLRISLWAKVEGREDSVKILNYEFPYKKTKGNTFVPIRVAGNEWKCYEKGFRHPDQDAFLVDIISLFHPSKGTVYVDDLKLEVKNGEDWEEIAIANSDFENYGWSLYGSLGGLLNWDTMYYGGILDFADSINALNGKYCLRLPAVQDSLLYAPAPIDKPYTVSLPSGSKAYIPLQLYADEKIVFPPTNRQAIRNLVKELQKNSLTVNQSFIAYALQIWAALYQDYPYRDAGLESKLNRLLLQTIEHLETDTTTLPYTILTQNFLMWINDPHLRLEGRLPKSDVVNMNKVSLPVKMPNAIVLTETQCVVNHVADSISHLQVGDVILKINNINVDSLLQVYRNQNISRFIQSDELLKLMTTYGKPEMQVQLLCNGKIEEAVFTIDSQQMTRRRNIQAEREKYQAIQDSLKKVKGVFYLNAIYPPDRRLGRSAVETQERDLNQFHVTDSLITELNKYRALILDVRGRPQNTGSLILFYLNQCMGIDLNRKYDVLKTSFFPVAKFSRDTLNLVPLYTREDVLIQVPVYVLIDYNTISAPERELTALRESGRATFIGSNTAGAAGPVNRTQIATGITLIYTTVQMLGIDDNPMSYQGTGIPPDIYVYPTPQGIAEGRDEVLEKAVEIALKNAEKK